jgi:hypothetical protein
MAIRGFNNSFGYFTIKRVYYENNVFFSFYTDFLLENSLFKIRKYRSENGK